ncbi:hypothetical protein [Daejeonella oryzae]|uniref:hypothetical protein n=1 Tax=Daejeonella oryzae TaxID=1122943 RepID=UPI00047EF465|nr:hypothetical protein [Daejeonella oryzae]
MKKLLHLFILVFICSFSSKSQGYKYSLSAGVGVTQSYADVSNSLNPQLVFHANADYYIKDFISIGAEFQSGKLINGREFIVPGENYRNFSGYFENDFKQLNINTKVGLGQFVDYSNDDFLKKIRGLYAGVGVGLISNNQKNVRRSFYSPEDNVFYDFEGSDSERMVTIPFNVGIDLFFKSKKLSPMAIGINSQMNLIPNDRLEGYDKDFNNRPDLYAFTSLSLKYRFGYSNMFNTNIFPR